MNGQIEIVKLLEQQEQCMLDTQNNVADNIQASSKYETNTTTNSSIVLFTPVTLDKDISFTNPTVSDANNNDITISSYCESSSSVKLT